MFKRCRYEVGKRFCGKKAVSIEIGSELPVCAEHEQFLKMCGSEFRPIGVKRAARAKSEGE